MGGNLVEQILNSCGVAYFWRGQFTCQDLVVFIDRQMQLAPGATGRNIVFFLMPFVFAIDLEPGRIDNDNTAWLHCFAQKMPG